MSLAEILSRALHVRGAWAPIDGLFTHPAGLHPDAAALLLELLPFGPVLDPFVGGGAVALAARRAGRAFIGRDVSEGALCVTRARCWMPSEADLAAYRRHVARRRDIDAKAAEPDVLAIPEPLRSAVQATLASSSPGRARERLADVAIQAWKHESGRVPAGTPPPDLARRDAREPWPSGSVAGVLTSPPYPGVYDYDRWTETLRTVRGQPGDIDCEIGSRREFGGAFAEASEKWREDTHAWTRAIARALCPTGRLVIVIGDGPRPDGPLDTRKESITAAESAGLVLVADATAEPGTRPSPRREHALLFERPPSS